MKGFYLYCIREKNNCNFSTKGMDGGEIFTIPYQDLEAIVSEVSLEKFNSEEIQKKAQEDLEWIKEKAQIHEYVIEQAMRAKEGKLISVIPMQFGVIFKNKENLVKNLVNHYQRFKESLENLEGKQEWGVKVFLEEDAFRKTIEEKNEQVLSKKKEIESLPKGKAFFAQKEIGKVISAQKDRELDRIREDIYQNLGQLAAAKNQSKLLEKDFTARSEKMILNGFYLIEQLKIDQFQKRVENLKRKYNWQGLIIEMTGPWPCYHFA